MIHIFDLDHTLLSVNISYQFFFYLYRQKIFSFFDLVFAAFYYVKHRFFRLSLTEYHHKLFNKLLKGKSFDLLNKHAAVFIRENVDRYIYAPALAVLQNAQRAGDTVMILSSSPEFLVNKVADTFSVEKYQGTQYEVDKDRMLWKISSIMDGNQKAKIARGEFVAYADSILDLPLLLSATKAVAVCPDRKLKAYAKEQGWQIL